MGIFDFLKRKPAEDPLEAVAANEADQPRCPHYTFAHVALRSVAFQQPLQCLAVLASPDARAFIADLLQSVSEFCREQGREADFRANDVVVHMVRAGGYPCAVIEMPPPRATTETFYVALVLLVDPSEASPDFEKVALRYFTLEKGFVLDGPPRTVLGEWTAEGSHVNYGDGPAPGLEPFLQAISELLAKE
jgi:hypothetical protein